MVYKLLMKIQGEKKQTNANTKKQQRKPWHNLKTWVLWVNFLYYWLDGPIYIFRG